MIQKRLEDIAEEDLLGLINNQVREGRTIDYKRELPGNSDGNKKEFLADVSSFANTAGGDLLFGIDEDGGLPTKIVGIHSGDLEKETLRLESILASGLEPRIRYSVRVIPCSNNRSVLLFRIERSWSSPHRIVFQENDRFWGRNSSGKYRLDVNELRAAFTLSSTTIEKIRAYRTDRIIALTNNEGAVPLQDGPKIVLHIVPIEFFAGQVEVDIRSVYKNFNQLHTMESSALSRRFNLEGVVTSSNQHTYVGKSYTQLYRNGIIEAVDGSPIYEMNDKKMIASLSYEQNILAHAPDYLRLLSELGINAPVMIALTLINAKNLWMATDQMIFNSGYPIDRDTLVLPESLIEDLSTPTVNIFKSMFDLIWNATGFQSSHNFNQNGDWASRR